MQVHLYHNLFAFGECWVPRRHISISAVSARGLWTRMLVRDLAKPAATAVTHANILQLSLYRDFWGPV